MLKTEATSSHQTWSGEDASPRIRPVWFIEHSALIVLLLAVTWLGAQYLNADALWYDEVWSLYYAGGQEYGAISPIEVIQRVEGELQHEKNPPGYYVLLNLWGGAVGWTEYATRALSLLAGALAVAWMYRAGCDIGGSRLVGLAAAVAVGGSALFVYYTHELRAYSLMVLFSAMLVSLYWRLMYVHPHHAHPLPPSHSGDIRPHNPGWLCPAHPSPLRREGEQNIGLSRRNRPRKQQVLDSGGVLQVGFVLVIAGGLYVHYLTALAVGAVGIYHLLVAPKNRLWLRVAILGAVGLGLFVPWLPILLRATSGAAGLQTVAMTTPEMTRELFIVFSNASLALLVICAVYALGARGYRAWYVWVIAAGGVGLAAALNTLYPVVTHVRYLIALWPLLGLVVAMGVERLAKNGITPLLILGVWLGAGVWNTVDPSFNRALNEAVLPWREFRAELTEHGAADDVVVFHAPDFNWFRELEIEHYMDGLPMRYSLMENIPGLQANDEYYHNAQTFVGNAPRVWVGVDKTMTPNFRLGEFGRVLDGDYALCYTAMDVPDMSMDLYARVPDSVGAMEMQFGDMIGARLLEPIRESEGQVSILLGWLVGESVPPDTYSVGLHFMDAGGNLVAQVDTGLPGQGYHCQQAAVTLAPGTYTVYAVVYNWQTGERLEGVKAESGEAGDRVEVGRIEVE